jgi:hypothetical protein
MSHLELPASPTWGNRLVLVSGEEGAGKSTIIRALLPYTPLGVRIDAEDIGQTNPCPMDDEFFDLLRRNVAVLVENFWTAGYVNVIAGSFVRHYQDYLAFRQLLTRPSAVFLVELLVEKNVRDHRRITRAKQRRRSGATWSTSFRKIGLFDRRPTPITGTSVLTRLLWTSVRPCDGLRAPSRTSMPVQRRDRRTVLPPTGRHALLW